MRGHWQIISCIALLIAAGSGVRAQQKSGLLLTTASGSADGQRFHAYWITRDGPQVQITEGLRLLVPRKSGWWEVGVTTLTRVNSAARSEAVWTAPVGEKRRTTHVIPVSDDDRCADDISAYSLSWVGTDFAALQHGYESTCGAHPVSGEESFVARLEDLRRKDQDLRPVLPLSEVAGAEAVGAMKLGADVADLRDAPNPSEDPANPALTASETSWIVVRTKGHYRLLGTSVLEHGHGGETYAVPIDPPKTLVGADDLAVGWDSILEKLPDASDAYTSPDGDLLVLITPHFLSIFEVQNKQIGKRLARVGLEAAAVISAQWAPSGSVDGWNTTLVPLLQEAPVIQK